MGDSSPETPELPGTYAAEDAPVGETLETDDEWSIEATVSLIEAEISDLSGTDSAEVLDNAVGETLSLESNDEWAAQPAQEAITEDDYHAEISELAGTGATEVINDVVAETLETDGVTEWAAAFGNAAQEAMYVEGAYDDLVGDTVKTDTEWTAARLAQIIDFQ